MVAAAFSGCSSIDDEQNVADGQCPFSGIASKLGGISESEDDNGESTRSIFFGGSNGNRFFQGWDTYDEPMVYSGSTFLGTLKPSEFGVSKTTLTGTLSGTFSVGNQLTLYSPSPECDFRGQKGSIASMSANYSFMTTTATIAKVSGSNVTTSDMNFSSFCEFFTFIFTDENERLLHVKKLTITSETGQLVETLNLLTNAVTYTNNLVITTEKENSTSDYPTALYVVILNHNTATKDTYTLTAVTSDGKTYEAKNTWSSLFGAGKHIYVRRQLECIDVEAGVSTGITPPTDEDVVIDNVTKE